MANYIPSPMSIGHVELTDLQKGLIEELAENAHEIWAQKRMQDGWTWGVTRDDEKKRHPCLVPYNDLPDSEKAYDRELVEQTLMATLALGYEIRKA